MKWAVRTLAELGDDVVLAPERHVLLASAGTGTPLGELVVERTERIEPATLGREVVLDTTHAKDGVLDVTSALRDVTDARSAKKRAYAGDVLVSRLRPYLRQIALVHDGALGGRDGSGWRGGGGGSLAVSTEFYVLAPRSGEGLAWLVPWLLSASVQEALAAAQEGGHHPRVPRSSLLALRVPAEVVRRRARASRAVAEALAGYYAAEATLRGVLGVTGGARAGEEAVKSPRAGGRGARARGTRG